MDKKHRFSFPAVGGSSLLVIFAVLCLTVFALLGLSTVQADQRLSDASARAVSNYYTAELEAEQTLSQLRQGSLPPGVSMTAEGVYAYSCPISDTQALQAEVRILEDGSWEILRWQAVTTVDWKADETRSVWTGN